ncbi:hypothetical protein IWQ60_007552 [Tieghemiomyces parasiticus]|uniref:Tyrosinase copper-binding domain-containing protein n=1 Tax=Tieghemiomyces parasiticus TaxID=78921 RepID=A0A9W7ZWU4_9FUNG|nr:hypothetical protein IWQ60_007552 [Tieghemiomyces parasiticus]
MNSTERRRFLAAHRRLNDPRSSRPNRFDHLVAHHGQHHDFIHEGAPIFPWHRVFISDYEAALQVIDPAVTLPYWDWSEHGLYPETSPVFQGGSDWFGGNGAGPHHCVPDGALADLPVFYTEEKTFPAGQAPCLRRRFDKANGTMSTWFEDVAIRRWLRAADNYTEFREAIEPPHWLVHTSLAGDMNTRYAPNDVLFFLHHAYIDKLWNDWMAMDLSGKRYSEYNGQFKDGSPAAPTDIIRGYDQIRVVDVIDSTANPRLCYVYA